MDRKQKTKPTNNPLFASIPVDSAKVLLDFDSVVQGVRPLSSKQHQMLPKDIRNLFHLLTDERGERRCGYMNETAALSAYVRYYQWWNLVRLTRLFSGLAKDVLHVPQEGICLDMGSGPLTVPIALWLACPHLRKKKLTWYCLDTSQTALSLGEDLFLSVAARTAQVEGVTVEPWKIIRIKGDIGTPLRNKVDFAVCANVLNEVVQSSGRPPEYTAKKTIEALEKYAKEGSCVLVVEPGTPPSVRFLSSFREALIRKGWDLLSPCPHSEGCPMDGKRGGKWCHFVFSAQDNDIPPKLKKLSELAGLSKDRATLSFVLARYGKTNFSEKYNAKDLSVRIASDAIRLPGGRTGYYGCSKLGLTLLASSQEGFSLGSGELVRIKMPPVLVTDKKSGAVLIELR